MTWVAALAVAAGCADVGDMTGGAPAEPDTAPTAKAAPLARGWDANRDGREDLLWWNASTGQLVSWNLSATGVASTEEGGVSPARPFSVRSLLRSPSSGCRERVSWVGSRLEVSVTPIPGVPSRGCPETPAVHDLPGWTLIDVEGRYTRAGTGRTDLLFRNGVGTVAIWSMAIDGSVAASGFPATAPLEWSIVDGRGDFDGDGVSDILWRNTSGTVAMWRMQSISGIAGVAFFGTAPADSWSLVEAAGDYDDNGRSDLLWVDVAGNVVAWSLTFSQQRFDATSLGVLPAGSRVLDGATDVDLDGRSDIVWRTPAGEVFAWLIGPNRTSRSSFPVTVRATLPLGSLGAEWQYVGRGAR